MSARAAEHPLRGLLERLCARHSLERTESRELFGRVIQGALSEVEIAALLVAWKAKGETPEEIAGAAEALRAAAIPFERGDLEVADNCGTGGDGLGTVNISTASAVLAAELGLHMAKHGNRAVSSRCGSADVLESLGVKIDAPAAVARRCLDEERICFLYAPQYHAGVKHVMPVRRALGVRTLFNMIGPLSNPARPRWQVMGVYDPALCEPLAETLGLLGCTAALVVHGAGLDEIALHGPTHAALWREGVLTRLTIDPAQLGVTGQSIEALRGGDGAANGAWLRTLLGGGGDPAHCDAVALNAGALLWISGRADDLQQGFISAREALRTGRALARLERWAELSHAGA